MSIKRGTESDILKACLDFLRLHRVMAWRANNAGVYDPAAKRFRLFRGMRGVSDIIGILRVDGDSPRGRFLAVETKTATGKLSAEQRIFLDGIRADGGVALVVRSVGELEAAMRAEGVIES